MPEVRNVSWGFLSPSARITSSSQSSQSTQTLRHYQTSENHTQPSLKLFNMVELVEVEDESFENKQAGLSEDDDEYSDTGT